MRNFIDGKIKRTRIRSFSAIILLGVILSIPLIWAAWADGWNTYERYTTGADVSRYFGTVAGSPKMLCQTFTVGNTGPDENFIPRGITYRGGGDVGTVNAIDYFIVGVNSTGIPEMSNIIAQNTTFIMPASDSTIFRNISINTTNQLSMDNQYAICMNSTQTITIDLPFWMKDNSSATYTGGSAYEQMSGGNWVNITGADFLFNISGVTGFGNTVQLNVPIDNSVELVLQPITFNCSGQDDVEVVNLTLIINDVFNETQSGGGLNFTSLQKNVSGIALGTHNWTCRVTDNLNNVVTASAREFNVSAFTEGNIIFNNSAFETSTQTFITNITTTSEILTITPILNYNGTRYLGSSTCSGPSCTLSVTIDLPLITADESQNRTWLWEVNGFTSDESFLFNTTALEQNVSRIRLDKCDATYQNNSLNFTAFREDNLSSVDPFEFEATFDIWLGSGGVVRTLNFSEPSISSIGLCVTPDTQDLRTRATIEYDEVSGTNFTRRNYYFDNDIINTTLQEVGLGLLLSSDSTSFILAAQDTDLLPVSNVLIFTERYYPGLNEFRIVQVARTDENGQSIGFFKTETVDYRFILMSNGTTVLTTDQQKIIGSSVPFTLTFTIGEDEGSAWEDFEELDNLDYVNGFHKSESIYNFTYTDTSGNLTSVALEIYKINASGDDPLICNQTITQSSATLSCNLTGNSTGQYISKGVIYRNSVRNLIFQEQFNIESFSEVAGDYGLFLGWFIILISAFAFSFNEIAGIFMMNIAMIFVNAIGFIAFGPVFISSMIAISILIGVILER